MDTQVPDTTLAYLADHYNQTIVEYITPGGKEKRDYLLDINPWSRQRERGRCTQCSWTADARDSGAR